MMDRVGLGELKKLTGGEKRFTLVPDISRRSQSMRSMGYLGNLVNEYNVPTKRPRTPGPIMNRSVGTLQWPPKRTPSTPDSSDYQGQGPVVRGTLLTPQGDAILGIGGVELDQTAILKGMGPGASISTYIDAAKSRGVDVVGQTAQLRQNGDRIVLSVPADSRFNAVFNVLITTVPAGTGPKTVKTATWALSPGQSRSYTLTEGGEWWMARQSNVDADITLTDTPPSSTEAARIAEEKRLQDALLATQNRTDIDAATKSRLINDLQAKLGATTAYDVSGALTPMLPWLVVGGVGIAIVAALFAGRKK